MPKPDVCALDCERPVLARGLCQSHYYKAKRAGTLDEIAPSPSGPCEHCGGPVPAGRRWGARFCSRDCKQHFADAEKSRGKEEARRRRKRSCAWCKQPLPLERRIDARFCSEPCTTAWHNHEAAAIRRSAGEKAKKPCVVCGSLISSERRSDAIYCSKACKDRSQLTGSTVARERKFDENLRRMYGLTTEEFEALAAKQGGKCAICGTTDFSGRGKRLHVDHCHEGGHIRGLLCINCNNGLGNFKDDPDILQAAIKYLLLDWARYFNSDPDVLQAAAAYLERDLARNP